MNQYPSLPPGMLRRNPKGKRGKLGTFKLRFRVQWHRSETPEVQEVGLHTRNPYEAHMRAVLILRSYAAKGKLAGWNGRRFDMSLLSLKNSPQKKTCTPAPDGLKQMEFPL